jgi:hypothetical protein
LHPGWRPGEDYTSHQELIGDWQIAGRVRGAQHAGQVLHTRHVDRDHRGFDGIVLFAAGAILRYVGSHYEYETDYSVSGLHIFQLLDPGPGWAALEAIQTLEPRVGDCYEAQEHIDDQTVGRWWREVFIASGV